MQSIKVGGRAPVPVFPPKDRMNRSMPEAFYVDCKAGARRCAVSAVEVMRDP